jgi:hypothetical protein
MTTPMPRRIRHTFLAVSAVVALTLAGCSGGGDASDATGATGATGAGDGATDSSSGEETEFEAYVPPDPPTIVESWVGARSAPDDATTITWGYGFTYENANSDSVYAGYTTVLLDASGSPIPTEFPLQGYEQFAVGTGARLSSVDLPADVEPASIEVTFDPANIFSQAGRSSDGLTVSDLTLALTEEDFYGNPSEYFTGLINSTVSTDLNGGPVVGVWRDSAGVITDMASDYVDIFQAQGATWFNLYSGKAAGALPAEVYVSGTPMTEREEISTLTLTETSFKPTDSGIANWIALGTNSGTETWSDRAFTFTYKVFDEQGRLIEASSYTTGALLRPGDSFAYSGSAFPLPGKVAVPARAEFTAAVTPEDVFTEMYQYAVPPITRTVPTPDGDVTVSDLAFGDGGREVTGTVTTTYDQPVEVRLTLVWRNPEGEITSTSLRTLDVIDPSVSTSTTFSFDSFGSIDGALPEILVGISFPDEQ